MVRLSTYTVTYFLITVTTIFLKKCCYLLPDCGELEISLVLQRQTENIVTQSSDTIKPSNESGLLVLQTMLLINISRIIQLHFKI